MRRIVQLWVVAALMLGAGAAPIGVPTQGVLWRALGFEWVGLDLGHFPGSSISVSNLGGGRVVSRTIAGDAGLTWGEFPDECCFGGEGDVRSYIPPDFALWRDSLMWRMTTPQGGLRVSEKIRSDKFRVELTGWPEFQINDNGTDWHLHPFDWEPGHDVGVHAGKASGEYRIYWQNAHSPPVLIYLFRWDTSGLQIDNADYFDVPGWEEPVYECDPENGCWQSDSIPKASGVLWWERTANMDLVYTPESPEARTGWLVLAGLVGTVAYSVFRRRRG